MIKYIIFDFDGTLADSGEIAFKAMNKMAKKHKFKEIEWSEIDLLRKLTTIERSKYMGVSLLKVPFLAPDFYLHYKEAMHELKLHPGMKELTEKLHGEGYGVAVISSNSENNIRTYFEDNNIENIDEILCSHHLFDKDKIINRFLRRHRLNKNEVIYAGDEIRDITACKKAGVKIIWVDWGLDVLEAVLVEKPDFTISEPIEIYNIIARF